MPAADLLVIASLVAVFGLSGMMKLRARDDTQDAFDSLRVPAWVPRRLGAIALPWVEILLAVALLIASGWILLVVTVGCVGLLTAYTLLIARALGFEEPVTCSCFGHLGGHRVDRLTLVRNVLLLALAGWAVTIGAGGRSFLGALEVAGSGEWAAVGAALLALTAAVLIVAGGEPTGPYGEGEHDYLRAPIPFGRLEVPGGIDTLRGLASTRARLLIFLSPNCGSCARVAALVDEWNTRVSPAVGVLTVYATAPEETHDHDPGLVAIDIEGNVRTVFGISGTPAAVLLGADGLMAGGPVAGSRPVIRLVDELLAELDSTNSNST